MEKEANDLGQARLIHAVGEALIVLISFIEFVLVIRAVLSWFPEAEDSKFGRIIYQLTEPVLLPFRGLFSRSVMASNLFIDISFIVAILVLELLQYIIAYSIRFY